MFDSIGSQIEQLSSPAIILIMILAFILLLFLNFEETLVDRFKILVTRVKLMVIKPERAQQKLNSKQIEELGNSLVGKFMIEDLLDGKEIIALKGTLISEHIAFEAEKRGLLQKLDSISVFWPVES